MFCDRHPNYPLRYFCESAICKIPICEECWENYHKDESHRVILLKVHRGPQNEVQYRLAKYKSEFKGVAQFLEGEWENLLKQVENAERKQQNVMQSKSANELESKSKEIKNFLELHGNDVYQFRSNFLSKIDKLQKSREGIFGNHKKNTESSSLNNGAPNFQKSMSSKKKKRELVGVTKHLVKDCTSKIRVAAAYNSSTKELFSPEVGSDNVIVFCIDETSREIEVKRKLNLQSLRRTKGGVEEYLVSMAMDCRNTLYGVIWRKSDQNKRLEVLDQNNLAKIGQLDTCGIENGRGFSWKVGAFGDTVVLAVHCIRNLCSTKWLGVTVFKNQLRQNTISLNIYSGQIASYLFLPNEKILLLSCDKHVAVVWLPPLSTPCSVSDSSSETQSLVSVKTSTTTATNQLLSGDAVDPRAVKIVKLPTTDEINTSIVWIASDDQPSIESLEGYLFVSEQCPNYVNFTLHVFKVDLEKVLSTNEHEREMTSQHIPKITSLKNTDVVIPISNSKIVATLASGDKVSRIVLLDLEYQKVP